MQTSANAALGLPARDVAACSVSFSARGDRPSRQHLAVAKALDRNLRRLRASRGLGIREMAAELLIAPATLGRLELDKGCAVPVLIVLYQRTGYSFERLLGLRKRKKKLPSP